MNNRDYIDPRALAVLASPVTIAKVDGDVGYTVLVLVEDDDWPEGERLLLAQSDMWLVSTKGGE